MNEDTNEMTQVIPKDASEAEATTIETTSDGTPAPTKPADRVRAAGLRRIIVILYLAALVIPGALSI